LTENRCVALLLIAVACFTQALRAEMVTVGNPGNASDSNGFGAVSYTFRISRYEFTNAEYVRFLNAVDPTGVNLYQIYSTEMTTNSRGGILLNVNESVGQKYSSKENMGNKPVNFVGWREAARVANWLHNGQGPGGTETGAYALNGSVAGDGLGAPARSLDALYWIPTEHEWYKAAYYNPEAQNGYFNFATQSDATPSATLADSNGNGIAGPLGNFANLDDGAAWNGQIGNLTTVGTNGSSSYYGTYDQTGNVAEWNDRLGEASVNKGVRGGDWSGFTGASAGSRYQFAVGTENSRLGFRLASSVPEPGSLVLMSVAGFGFVFKRLRRMKKHR